MQAGPAEIPISRSAGVDLASICQNSFIRFIDALHRSRRADAVRIIRSSQHLMNNRDQAHSHESLDLRKTFGA